MLGAGICGLVTSNILKDKPENRTNIKIVEQKQYFQFPPSYPWMMLGTRTPNQVQRNLDILKKEIDIIKENKQQ